MQHREKEKENPSTTLAEGSRVRVRRRQEKEDDGYLGSWRAGKADAACSNRPNFVGNGVHPPVKGHPPSPVVR